MIFSILEIIHSLVDVIVIRMLFKYGALNCNLWMRFRIRSGVNHKVSPYKQSPIYKRLRNASHIISQN